MLGVSYRFGQRAYKGVHPQEEVSSMAKSKRMTATVKMTFTEDTDLIAWWNSIPRGSRNAVMKDLMREYIERHRGGFRPVLPRNSPQPFDPGRFAQVCDDAAWIRSAMGDLPRYMEQVLQHVAALGVIQTTAGAAVAIREPTKVVDEVEASKREEKVRKAKW